LGFTRFQLGLFNGAYQGLAAVAALATASFTDRHRRYKEVAGAGYAVSAATRIGLVAAQHAWAPATGMLYADRAAKGVRTAPRDALISLSALPGRLAEAFGVHRAMDTLGALIGPLLAFVLLSAAAGGATGGSYSTIFVTSFWIALVGVAVLVLFVQNREPVATATAGALAAPRTRMSMRATFGLLRIPKFRRLVIAGTALGAVTIADTLVYLTFQQRTSMNIRYFPLLFVGTATAYVLLAMPMGRLADRVGAAKVFLGGQALLIIVDLVLLRSDPGPALLLVMLAAMGTYYAATDGILAAVATSILEPRVRTSGLALLGASMAVAALGASAVFGALWGWEGPTFAVGVFLGGIVCALALGVVLLRPLLRTEAGAVPIGVRTRAD
jgi:Na+/melibiose symporter-like transporter